MSEHTTPESAAETVEQALRAAASGDDSHEVVVRMTVHGGVASERYEFTFEGHGDGRLSSSLRCALTGRDRPQRSSLAPSASLRSLLTSLRPAAIAASEPPPQIPPDSLVGRLEITADGETVAAVFMADEEQARDAGYPVPPEVREAAAAIYELSAAQLDIDSAAP